MELRLNGKTYKILFNQLIGKGECGKVYLGNFEKMKVANKAEKACEDKLLKEFCFLNKLKNEIGFHKCYNYLNVFDNNYLFIWNY